MNRAVAVSAVALLVLFASCSKSPDLTGTWKNGDGNLLTISSDSSVKLGQEGLSGGDKGRYRISGDTLIITTDPSVDELGKYYNIFTLVIQGEKLSMNNITLYRSGDFQTITVADLAKRLGKSEGRFAFTRISR